MLSSLEIWLAGLANQLASTSAEAGLGALIGMPMKFLLAIMPVSGKMMFSTDSG